MKLQRCKMCGKTITRIQEHHIIPWWFSHDDSDSNIIRVCSTCHRKADASFNSLILYGKMGVSKDTNKRSVRRYMKKYSRKKTLFSFTLLKYAYYMDVLRYNTKIDSICITHEWIYSPKKYRYRSVGINARKLLVRAARSKSQITLSGGGIT